jgi:hypothetical protein
VEGPHLILLESADYRVQHTTVMEQDQVFRMPKICVGQPPKQQDIEKDIDHSWAYTSWMGTDLNIRTLLHRGKRLTSGAIPGRCILYTNSLTCFRSVTWAPSGYKALSRSAPLGSGSINNSAIPQGWTWKCRWPVTGFFHSWWKE